MNLHERILPIRRWWKPQPTDHVRRASNWATEAGFHTYTFANSGFHTYTFANSKDRAETEPSHCPQRLLFCLSFLTDHLTNYSRTSMARTPLRPWKIVRAMGSSSQWRLIMAPGREANIANSGKSIDLLYNNCMLSVLIRIASSRRF